MTAKELADAIYKLPPEQQNLKIGYYVHRSFGIKPEWMFQEYTDLQVEHPMSSEATLGLFIGGEEKV